MEAATGQVRHGHRMEEWTCCRTADFSGRHVQQLCQNPDRIQYAAGLYWYEWIGGLFVLIVVTIYLVNRLSN